MQFTQLFDDDRAVSPVIGVILMVAITVILAAVIGTFVLGMSDQMGDSAPKASFGFATTDTGSDGVPDLVTVTHESGATIDASHLQIKIASDSWAWSEASIDDVSSGTSVTVGDSGETEPHDFTSSGDIAGNTLRVVYDSPDSDSSSTLQKFEVPN